MEVDSKNNSNNNKKHKCALCELHPSAWSTYALLICAVAAAWKAENSKPEPKALPPTLAALAGVQVVKGKYQKIIFRFEMIWHDS